MFDCLQKLPYFLSKNHNFGINYGWFILKNKSVNANLQFDFFNGELYLFLYNQKQNRIKAMMTPEMSIQNEQRIQQPEEAACR